MEGIELGGDQQFCLRWNNFQANITSQFEALRDDEDFVDVTLACEGRRLEAHKVVLSACSPYFKELFKNNPCPHPIVFMRDCELIHVTALLEFMYAGEVNIAQAQLTSFLRTAEALQIRGLTDASSKTKSETKHLSLKSPPSQLRNLLCGKSSSTSPSKAANQITESFPDDNLEKTACHSSDGRRASDCENNQTHNDIHPSSSHIRASSDRREQSNYGAVRLKSDQLLKERNVDNASNGGNSDVDRGKGKINPLAVNNVVNFHTNPELLQHIIEPKLETPDYASDDEMKQDRMPLTPELFFNANQITNPFAALQGNVDFMAGVNRDFGQDTLEGNGYLMHHRARHLLNKNARGRSSLPWPDFRVPATINHDDEEPDRPPKLIKLAEGVEVVAERLRGVKWGDYRKVTRALAGALFSAGELATSSVTGQRWSRAGQEQRPTKPPLDRRRVQALISYVSRRFPGIEVSRIKQVLAYKCKENCAAFRMRAASDAPQMGNASTFSMPTVLSGEELGGSGGPPPLELGVLGRGDSPCLEISDENGAMP